MLCICKMKENLVNKAREILDNYLVARGHRKTPERYNILEACYSLKGHFSLEDLGSLLEKRNFRVSRATLYNTMRLFVELRILTRHNLLDGTKYEVCDDRDDHVHQVCTVCGKVTEIYVPQITQAVHDAELKGFRKNCFTLYIYGVCAHCQAKFSKRILVDEEEKSKKPNKNEHR